MGCGSRPCARAKPLAARYITHSKFNRALICVAICGNTIVDFNAAKHGRQMKDDRVNFMFFLFCIILVAIIVAIMDKELDWEWLVAILVSGILSLILAYLVEIDLALAESEFRASGTR
jgi:hypothetical protein